jgi:CheY-like chemotaxis protein
MLRMQRIPFVTVKSDGAIVHVNYEAAVLLGIPADTLLEKPMTDHLIEAHRIRFECELAAVAEGAEKHGRTHCVAVGADGIGRKLIFRMTPAGDGLVDIRMAPYLLPDSHRGPSNLSLFDSGRILPVARRILAITRRAVTKEELISDGLKVLAEAVQAEGGAALEWENIRGDAPILTIGKFDKNHLAGIYRAAIMARLTRGDVVVKETSLDGSDSGACLLILPLLMSTASTGVIVLQIARNTELVPEEQQSLVILGEIIGLGLKALAATPRNSRVRIHPEGDRAASSTLGRISAGFFHEINNAATILRNNVDQLLLRGDALNFISESAVKDSLAALDTMQDLSSALKAFGPEETALFEKVNLLRILDTISRSVRFYAKRGINIIFERPEDEIPRVRARSHHLIRVFYLIFAELFEAAQKSAVELSVEISLTADEGTVYLFVVVNAGPFSLPTVLLSQLEKGGALADQATDAGGELSYSVDHQGNLSIAVAFKESQRHSVSRAGSAAAVPYRRGTILIADDEVAVIRSLRRVLDQYYDIFAARSGEEAVDILRTNPQIEAVLYDVSMPRMGGIEFYEEVIRQGISRAERIIFVKAGSYDPEMTAFLSETTNPVVDKPFDIPMLNELIASLLM